MELATILAYCRVVFKTLRGESILMILSFFWSKKCKILAMYPLTLWNYGDGKGCFMNLHLTLYGIFCIFIRVKTTHFLSTPNILSLHWCWTEDQQFQSSRTRGSSRSGERLRWLSGSKTGRHAQPRTLWLKWKKEGEVSVAAKQTRCFLIGPIKKFWEGVNF